MGEKTSGVGHITIPAAPSAGVSVTSGAANVFTTTYVALTASTPSAIYITGLTTQAAVSAAVPTYMAVQLAVGATGAESIIDQQNVPTGFHAATTGTTVASYVPIFPPVPVATTSRVSAKVADSVGALPWLVQLTCIAQTNVVDDGVGVTLNATQTFNNTGTWTGSVTGSVGSVTGAVGSVTAIVTANITQIASVTSKGAGGYVGIDWAQINAPTTVQGLTGTTISATQTVATVTGNVTGSVGSVVGAVGSVTGAVGSVTGAVGSVTARVTANTDQWAGGTIPAPNTTGVPVVDTRQLVRTNTAQAGGTTTSIVLDAGASATNGFYNGMICQIISGGGSPEAGIITAYVGATKTATISPALPTAPGATSVFQIFPAMVDLETIAFATTKGAAGYAGVDWASINAPTTVQGLTGTTISATQTVATVTGNVVGSVGSVTGSVGSISGVTFPTNFSATAITAGGAVTVGTNNDKTGYTLTQTFPANFSSQAIDASGNVSTTSNVKKNTAFAAFMFVMYDNALHAPKTGLTVTATRSLDGAAFAACANAVTEISNGWYQINLAATDTNANRIGLRFSASGADDTDIEINTQP